MHRSLERTLVLRPITVGLREERNIEEVLAQEPHLDLIGAEQRAHPYIGRLIVFANSRTPREYSSLCDPFAHVTIRDH